MQGTAAPVIERRIGPTRFGVSEQQQSLQPDAHFSFATPASQV
jgi:hypothetical protein